jgi:hypothetical protein
MRVTATRTYPFHLGFVSPNGVTLPAVGSSPNYVDIKDIYADHLSMIAMVSRGDATIGSFSRDASDQIGQTELNEHLLGLYSCSFPTNTPGNISGGTSAAMVSTNAEPYNLRAKNYFKFYVDGSLSSPVYTVEVYVQKGLYTATTLAQALNADATFATHLVASVSGGTKVQVQTRSKGASSFIVAQDSALAPLADANDILDFPTTTPTSAATGTASRIAALLLGPTGVGLHKAKIKVAAYTTDAGSGDVVTAGAFLQVVRNGTVVSGLYTAGAEAVVQADADGVIDVEIADVTHADTPVYLGFRALDNYDFALIPSTAGTRVSVTNT